MFKPTLKMFLEKNFLAAVSSSQLRFSKLLQMPQAYFNARTLKGMDYCTHLESSEEDR
jgi:hypothetical protein